MRKLPLFAPYAVAAALLLSTSGCSESADPAEVADLASRYTSSANPLGVPLTADQAECRAKMLLESDLSEKALEAIRAGKAPKISSEHDIEVMRDLADDLSTECLDAK